MFVVVDGSIIWTRGRMEGSFDRLEERMVLHTTTHTSHQQEVRCTAGQDLHPYGIFCADHVTTRAKDRRENKKSFLYAHFKTLHPTARGLVSKKTLKKYKFHLFLGHNQ